MLNTMICKENEQKEEKRFCFCKERSFFMPVLDKQIMYSMRV